MNKLLKIFSLFACLIFLSGCVGMRPSERVENMLNKYVQNDQDIMKELDSYLEKQDLNDSQKSRYKDIIKDEYSNIIYEITKENIEEDRATVEVALTVKNLYAASNEAQQYLLSNPTEFYTDGVYDVSKFIDYKLSVMEDSKETIDYAITVNLSKKDNVWQITDLDEATLEKIHGIYDYTK